MDEGILHAYLDGALDALHEAGALPDRMTPDDVMAHLRQCADCRARLDIERAVRDGAGLVLRDAAGPAAAPPPFENMSAAPRPRRAAWMPYAWAASLVMAVGAGWWGSQLARDENVRQSSQQSAPAAVEEAAGTMADAAPVEIELPAPLPPATTAPATAGPAERARQAAAGAAEKTMDIPAAPPSLAAVDSSRTANTAANTQLAADAGALPLNQQRGATDTQQRATQDALQRGFVAAAPPPPPPALAPPPAPAAPPAQPMAAQYGASRFFATLLVIDSESIEWRAAAADSVAALGIEGATQTRIETADVRAVGSVLRVRQRVGAGEVEIIQLRAEEGAFLSARTEAREAAQPVPTVLSATVLPGGVQQLVARIGADTYVAIRSAEIAPHTLMPRLVPLRPAR